MLELQPHILVLQPHIWFKVIIRLTSAKVEVEVEAELGKIFFVGFVEKISATPDRWVAHFCISAYKLPDP